MKSYLISRVLCEIGRNFCYGFFSDCELLVWIAGGVFMGRNWGYSFFGGVWSL